MAEPTNSKVPQIRFKGFEGEWVEKTFKEITGRATQSESEETLPRLEYEDIISNSGRLNKDLTKKESNKKGIKFEKGDVLFGKLRPYLRNWLLADFEGIAVGDFWVLKPSGAVSSFIFSLIQTEAFETIANQSAGSKMPRSDWNLVSNSVFLLPFDTDEQTQIGGYFKELDRMIGLHQRKHGKLVTLKQAMLQKMFPQNGATTPEIRFKGFEGEWVEKKLGEVLSPYPFRPYLADPSHSGNFEVIQQGDKPLAGFASGLPFENYDDVILFGDHTLSLFLPLKPFFVASDGIKIFGNRVGLERDYLYASLVAFMPDSEGYKRHANILKNVKILFSPDSTEQQKIGSYFRQLDTLITKHATQLEKLKQLKAACLERMFV
jgi:type I restriction enzyme, S subunit